MTARHVFLDTMLFLHYRFPDQIDWRGLTGADEVVLVLAPVVIRELNKHKDGHAVPRLRKRAASSLTRLHRLFDAGPETPLRSGVTVRFVPDEPAIDFDAHRLSRDTGDDQLIASILAFRNDRPEASVMLATADLTLKMKVPQHAIALLPLTDDLKLPEEPDPQEQRVKHLERQLAEERARTPDLALNFADGAIHARVTLPRPVDLSVDVERQMAAIRQQHPKRRAAALGDSLAAIAATMSAFSHISPEDIADYNAALDRFYADYERYLRDDGDGHNAARRTVRLEMVLRNSGTSPAEDIDVFLHFPDGFELYSEDEVPEEPEPPRPPEPPQTTLQKMTSGIGALPGLHAPLSLPSSGMIETWNVSSPTIRKTNSYDVDVHVRRLKQHLSEPLDPLFVVFASFDAAASFGIDYRINAGNLPREATGRLDVAIAKEGERTGR